MIKVAYRTTLVVTGTRLLETLNLSAGWNFVGLPVDKAIRSEEAFAPVQEDMVSAHGFNDSAGKWQRFHFDSDKPAFLQSLATIAPSKAYWINMYAAGTIPCHDSLTENTFFFHGDHLGSNAIVTDMTGAVVEQTAFYPYGKTRYESRTGFDSAYKFTDQELDHGTGLYNYDARLYDPVIGMFITPDSIVPDWTDPQSLNRYAYCRNNPLIYVDPSGHDNIYYDDNGNYLQTQPNAANDVYLTSNAQNTHLGSQDMFNMYTAAIYGESSGDTQESRAIADVIMNRAEFTGNSTSDIILNTGVFGYNNNSRTTTNNGTTLNTNANLLTARASVIETLTRTNDTSGGAYFWDGADITTNSHRQWGFVYSNASHDIYSTGDVLIPTVTTFWYNAAGQRTGVRGTYDHKLIPTAAFGGTIFWEYDSGFTNATGNRAYP